MEASGNQLKCEAVSDLNGGVTDMITLVKTEGWVDRYMRAQQDDIVKQQQQQEQEQEQEQRLSPGGSNIGGGGGGATSKADGSSLGLSLIGVT